MNLMDKEFHDDSSSYDEILDFESPNVERENDVEDFDHEEEIYFRSLDEY